MLRGARQALLPAILSLLLAAVALAPASRAQSEAPAASAGSTGEGRVLGQVFDGETGTPLPGVSVTVVWPSPADGAQSRQEVRETSAGGDFEFASLPAGTYSIRFQKEGYRDSRIADFAVQAGQANRADFALPPLAEQTGPAADSDIEEFVVLGAKGALESLDLRVESDELLNVLSAEELSRFAASDVAEGLKRVAGVNVVEGQFAIIRGLEDRYSATLYNSAPIPSPDPDRQSVQLDLFPSEVVSNLIVAKTFSPELPSNAAGGSIDIVTRDYPGEPLAGALRGAAGFNQYAIERFLGLVPGSPVGEERAALDTLAQEYGGFLGGRTELAGREIRYKAVLNWDLDYGTAEGYQEGRQPRRTEFRREGQANQTVLAAGGLAEGELELTAGRFDLTTSERSEQATGYGGFGFDLDTAGNHRIDLSAFYTRKKQGVVESKENGYLPGFDYSVPAALQEATGSLADPDSVFLQQIGNCRVCGTRGAWIAAALRSDLDGGADRGPLWFTHFAESRSYDIERDLLVTQINGEHWLQALAGLHLGWAANYAHTTQQETALGAGIFFEPANVLDADFAIPTRFPVAVQDLGPGVFATTSDSGIISSFNDIDESQGFGRLDVDYQIALSESVFLNLSSGGWYESATRDVASQFVESPTLGGRTQFSVVGSTPLDLGRQLFGALDAQPDGKTSFTRETSNESRREIWAWSLGSKATLWERLDLLGGFRLENLRLESINDAFTLATRGCNPAAPATFPETFILFDRLDNPSRCEARPPAGTIFNDQVLGLRVPVDPVTGFVDLTDRAEIQSVVDGEVDERQFLPSAGLVYRPLPGLSWRNAWSQTVARPSFREMGFYASVELGSDDLVVGNPQLQLSEVTSWDTRLEYTWGELGELLSLSGFYKTIENPIESILVRNPIDVRPGVLWRTWFNNPNTAKLWGIELEARKNLDFLGIDFAEYFSVGGNFTYIHAEVERTEAELLRAGLFFLTPAGEPAAYSGLERSRRLFNQPEWIANADLSFEQPDWGTKLTLAYFAISDVLDAAGTSILGPDLRTQGIVLDRYLDSYGQLDLVLSQTWSPAFLRGGSLTIKASLKNLTDSTRRLVYDREQTNDEIAERSYKIGRDFKFGVTYAF
jgi:outer membrane receptor protein involved in Fe transport